ncbi:MAG: D-aminoacyl-tRNA deacylase [Alphaproteobacteria bacterium]|nr:D-aminoacyl-tRNA deacylase [Alphaproteobacteria bacterium]
MKILVQKVLNASVTVNKQLVSQINQGFLLFIGVEKGDTQTQADFLAKKIANLRIFEDENNKMNLSIQDVKGEILAVSQFTLAADLSRGNRPGFDSAARPEEAKLLYEYFVAQLQTYNLPVQTGIFQADMKVALINDGPCTFILEK